MRSPHSTVLALLLCGAGLPTLAFAQSGRDCNRSSFGLVPLPDLGGGTYRSVPGGLYPGGTNALPPAHLAAGLQHAAQVIPRNAAGQPDPAGRIALLSIGMSNTTQEFSTWRAWSELDPHRARSVVVVDGAQGGQDARIIADPNANFWTVVAQRLANAGVSDQQVQVIWLKEAMAAPGTTQFPAHVVELQGFLEQIARNLHDKFPQARLCFLSSRSYGGYSTHPQRTEPLSYETGFAVRGAIEAQIQGAPLLNHDPALGAVRSPWLAWGPYLWADGLNARSDGLRWRCEDYVTDGVHPSGSGRLQVADLLEAHWTTHPCAASWYVGPQRPARAGSLLYGNPCNGVAGEPRAQTNTPPTIGNASFRLGLTNAAPSAPAALFLALDRARTPLATPCDLWLDTPFAALATTTAANGAAQIAAPIPPDPLLEGLRVYDQWFVIDATGTPIPGLGPLSATTGQLLQLGL
ncbi:MAG: hypothetical protein JNM84_00215 [Planctomycetes bacterium]|nr:hypothetical protein [Planctomycetota bacterium]